MDVCSSTFDSISLTTIELFDMLSTILFLVSSFPIAITTVSSDDVNKVSLSSTLILKYIIDSIALHTVLLCPPLPITVILRLILSIYNLYYFIACIWFRVNITPIPFTYFVICFNYLICIYTTMYDISSSNPTFLSIS